MRASPKLSGAAPVPVQSAELSPLQQRIAARAVDWLRTQDAGVAITEVALAQQLGVSRTPVRAALALLAQRGVLKRVPGAGYQLRRARARLIALDFDPPVEEADRVFLAIAKDRLEGQLPVDVSEADLMRRYEVTRPTILKVLARLAEVGQVERKTGHGWAFMSSISDAATRIESYRFRQLIEPAALTEPGFSLDADWLADMRTRHEAMLRKTWRDTDALTLFELNAEFHEGLAAASGNRFFQMAMQQQNRLRRFVNVYWTHGPERVAVSCQEHLDILARLEAGDHEVASALMRRHLQQASVLADPGG
jgi:DNA-binding GntR family transcriptional regulator